MKFSAWIVLLFLIAMMEGVQTCSAQNKPAAELVIVNAKVWTGDKTLASAQAVAILGDRIVAVGGNPEVEAWRGPNTRVIDAGGKLLLPGFNDSHVHFVSGGMQLDSVDLKDAPKSSRIRSADRRSSQDPSERRVDCWRKLGRNQMEPV
jgi:predicted amidohydrolase YtcJ